MEETSMDANVSSPTSSALSSGGVNVAVAVNSISSATSFIQAQTTPAVTVEYLNHDPEPEPGEIVDMVQPAPTPSPPPSSDGDLSPPPTLTASSALQQPNGLAASSGHQNSSGGEAGGSGRSNSSSSPVASNPIASDHCYGLPYQDHNYGSASSYSNNRNNSGNGNGTSGNNGSNNGGSYSSGSQRHPSGSHRLSISSGGTGAPAQVNRLSNGGGTPVGGTGVLVTNRRLNFYPNGNNSKPPTLPHYGPAVTSDSRVSPSIGSYAVDRTSFSDDDGPVRSDAYGLMSTGLSAPVLSPATGNGSSPTMNSSSTSAIPSSPGNGLTVLSHSTVGQSGITVTTSGQVQVRGRLRSIGMRPLTEDSGLAYHSTPAIHPRLAPPNPARSGVGSMPSSSHGPLPLTRNPGRIVTSSTIGSNFNSVLLSPGPPTLQKQQQIALPHSIRAPSVSGTTSLSAFPRQGLSSVLQSVSLPTANGSGQQPPPKRPGRPKGARSLGPNQRQSIQVPPSMLTSGATMMKPVRRRKLSQRQPGMQPFSSPGGPPPGIYATGVHQPPGTPFSPSGLMGQPPMVANRTTQQNAAVTTSSPVDTVSSVLEAVAAGLTTPPSLPLPLLPPYHQHSLQHPLASYQSKMNTQLNPAHSSAAHEAIGGPLMVGTSPIIPAHPMFMNATANVSLMGAGMMNSQQLQQQQQHQPAPVVPTQEKLSTSPSTSSVTTATTLGKQGFRENYNNMMAALYNRIGISEKDDEANSKSRTVVKSSPISKSDQRQAPSFREGKAKGRQKKPKAEPHLADEAFAAMVKTEPVEVAKVSADRAKNGKASADDGTNTSTDEEGDSSGDEWEGKDYTTRCLCDMQHNDEFMIQCDRCEVWQHCECMGLDTKNIPDNYLCERCDPRPLKLAPVEAQRLQQAKVLQWKRKKAAAAARRRRRVVSASRASMSSSSSAIAGNRGRPRKSVDASTSNIGGKRTISTGDTNANKRLKLSSSPGLGCEAFTEAARNVCTAKVAKAVRMSGDTVGAANLLSQLPSEPPCKSMYVAVGRQGLVATATVLPDLPIIEYRGKVCWSTDFEIPDGKGGRLPVVTPYLLYYRSGGADGSDIFSICVDARFTGTSARFVRRSCQPNSQVKHVVYNGALHVLLVSTELIECGAEVTIPFDYDISKCNFKLECACANSPLVAPNIECPVQVHNKSLPLPALIPAAETSGGADADQMQQSSTISNQPQPVKRRPGRPPGSGKAQRQQQANNRIATSATTAAARKKSKKARGFKVRIVGKKKGALFEGSNIRGGKAKGAAGKLKLRQPERTSKKLKPTATADLTKRRFSDDHPDEAKQNGSDSFGKSPTNTPATGSGQKHGGGKLSRTKSLVSPTAPTAGSMTTDQQQHLSREERKMQTLMEQISRMEQREQKKAEKKMAKLQSGGKPVKPGKMAVVKEKKLKTVGRRKSATMDRTVAAARRKRAESEAAVVAAAKRPRLWSENGETSSSISSIESEDHDAANSSKMFMQSSMSRSGGFGNETRATIADSKHQSFSSAAVYASSTSPPVAQHPKAGDVAKKRWLRQAMEETKTSVSATTAAMPTTVAVHVDMRAAGESTAPMQISPSSAVAPPKKRIIQEFSHSAAAMFSEVAAPVMPDAIPCLTTASQVSNDTQEGPISTVEAAQLLAELHNQQLLVTQKSTEPVDGVQEWASPAPEQQSPQTASSSLKMIYPEEHPPPFQPVTSEEASSSLTSASFTILATTTAAVDAASFTAPPYFTATKAPIGGDQSNILTKSYPVPTTSTGLLYSAIEDDIPTVASRPATEATQPPTDTPLQVQKKKVMSIDEYKKRKRESVNDVTVTTPNAESADVSPTSSSGTTPTTSGAAPSVQRQHSFIPVIKDGDVASRNIRLSSVPDPETIGKCSATLDDLRKRIYNRTYSRKQAPSETHESSSIAPKSPVTTAPIGTDPRTAANVIPVPVPEPATPPRDSAAVQPTDLMEDSPEAMIYRKSLTDRLREEFGLE